MARGLR